MDVFHFHIRHDFSYMKLREHLELFIKQTRKSEFPQLWKMMFSSSVTEQVTVPEVNCCSD